MHSDQTQEHTNKEKITDVSTLAFNKLHAEANQRNQLSNRDIYLVDPKPQQSQAQEESLLTHRLIKILGKPVASDEAVSDSFKAQEGLKLFKERAKQHGLSSAEVARTFHQLNLLLADNEHAKLSLNTRAMLASQILMHAARPDHIDQGKHNTCSMTAVEKLCYWGTPSRVASVITEVVLTGSYLDLDQDGYGKRIQIPKTVFRPGQEESTFFPYDGKRDFSSEIFQVTAINIASQKRVPPEIYEQLPATPTDTGERLFYKDGNRVLEKNGEPKRAPSINLAEMASVLRRLTGKSESVLAYGSSDSSSDIIHFNSSQELQLLLSGSHKRLPVIIKVDAADRLFFPAAVTLAPFQQHAWHVVTVQDVQGNSAYISNQWGSPLNL